MSWLETYLPLVQVLAFLGAWGLAMLTILVLHIVR